MHTVIVNSYKLRLIKNSFGYLGKFGLKFTSECILDFLGIKMYSTIEYPFVGSKVRVRIRPFWKRLERGQWELNCIRYVSSSVKEGQTILDVGAGFGAYTLLFSKLVQNTGQIHAFEPNPKAFGILRDNIEKNSLTNTYIREVGISNSIGKAHLKARGLGGFDNSMSTLIMPKGSIVTDEICIETTTIDRYCEENDICPDGIKIDVEGAEGLVIEGSRVTIAKCSPWILLEFHSHLMSKKERGICWHRLVDCAKEVTFIGGESNQYNYGDNVESIPDCLYFHVFIKY